ncbi:hypothetical protein H8D85_00530 [bacterium]|nr:hypothetical protein [bacterium]
MDIKELNKILDNILDLGDENFDAFMLLISKFARIASMVQAMVDQSNHSTLAKALSDMDTSDIEGVDDSEISDILNNLDPNNSGDA